MEPDSAEGGLKLSRTSDCTPYDLRFIEKLIGGRAHEHEALPAFYGLRPDEVETPRAYRLYEEASPINYVSADDPPVFLVYSGPRDPMPPHSAPGGGIHHARFGDALKEKLAPLGIECVLRHRSDYEGKGDYLDAMYREMVEFFVRHFTRRP